MSMNMSLHSIVNISCSSLSDNVSLTLVVPGASFTPITMPINGGITVSATFIATMNLNGTTMRCHAVGPGSELDSSAALLLIQGPPSASTIITWLRPFTLDGVPLSYDVNITNIDTGEVVDSANVSDEQYLFSPMDLSATYNVQLLARNAAGTSDGVNLKVVFSKDVVAIPSGISRDMITWMLNFTLLNSCVNEVVVNATINLCPNNEEQNCYSFLGIEESIQQLEGGKLNVSFAVQILEDITYNSTLQLFYERGQELRSSTPLPISTVDAQTVVSNHSNGSACFSIQKIVGSVLYGIVVQFVDASSGNNIIRLVVVNTSNVCIDDLDPGVYSISVGELNVPLVPTGQEITIQENNTLTENTPSPSLSTPVTISECQTCDGHIIGLAVLALIVIVELVIICCCTWIHRQHIQKCCRHYCIWKCCCNEEQEKCTCVSIGFPNCVRPTGKEVTRYRVPVEETPSI